MLTGRVGEGVLGPYEEAADVKDDSEPAWELAADPMELTRGDVPEEEYAWWGRGNGKDGNLSLLMYDARWLGGALWYETSVGARVWT